MTNRITYLFQFLLCSTITMRINGDRLQAIRLSIISMVHLFISAGRLGAIGNCPLLQQYNPFTIPDGIWYNKMTMLLLGILPSLLHPFLSPIFCSGCKILPFHGTRFVHPEHPEPAELLQSNIYDQGVSAIAYPSYSGEDIFQPRYPSVPPHSFFHSTQNRGAQ